MSEQSSDGAPTEAPPAWHACSREEAARALETSLHGLDPEAARARLQRFGPNSLSPPPPPSRLKILLRQFRSPLIYVLLAAALIALALGETSDAGFIAAVLLINALIGYINEHRAETAVRAMMKLVPSRARVHRGGRSLDIDAREVVPGDLLLLESGARVSADSRLIESQGLRVDESLLTGESLPVAKDADVLLPGQAPVADRLNMTFAGSMVASGRAMALVVATGQSTEVGAIAGQVAVTRREPPPLLRRMEVFARRVGAAVIAFSVLIIIVGVIQGQPLDEMLFAAIALAVSAIPEGLPIALTVALAVAVSRMARRRVIVRNLPAVEALGSCGVIATDKTGTLTQNQLTVERVVAGDRSYTVTGVGYTPEGRVLQDHEPVIPGEHPRLFRLARAVALANEGSLSRRQENDGEWEWSGDPTDVALLAFAVKAGMDPVTLLEAHQQVAGIPFEPEKRYMATFHRSGSGGLVCVKGAPERVLSMCDSELDHATGAQVPLDVPRAQRSIEALMREGFRVLAAADTELDTEPTSRTPPGEPAGLRFLGLIAMTDPPREGVDAAIRRCREAGIRTIMITGDHAVTARAIAERIGLGRPGGTTITGEEIAEVEDEKLPALLREAHVIARAAPADKLRVIQAHQRLGDFVAVTGDGVNDAPALRQANIGVAMGRAGTDVAREAADLVITDDDFSSIVAGVEEGRVAYDNVRKVTYLLVSTGAGEVLAVTGALAMGLPIPFTAVQLLWLNLVTNGIQDVALAFEPGEPGVLRQPPRPPRQGIFDRLMVERTVLAGLVFGLLGLACFAWWTSLGWPVETARNSLVQLFVLFEIFHIGNARSETRSIFRMSPFSNPVLLLGTLGALGVHLAALQIPFMQNLLDIKPLELAAWIELGALAAPIIVVMEAHKLYRRRTGRR